MLNAVPDGIVSLGVQSIISDYDTSQLITTTIVSIPKSDVNDIPLGLEKTSNNAGKGAFEGIIYIVRPKTKVETPDNTMYVELTIKYFGNDQFPEGYIHSRLFILYNLFYHPKKGSSKVRRQSSHQQ
ncbi:hypothetical protein F8M41_011559 [Gigaspora margarita]|uniref:Uncharacterized protein n=1 Tax=Gigaspora margarita TaxID=4874 RepID=A0A8H3WYZ4_GIGMA|nr:hypothetical protein F8M41_011559 [Gigaspora margarita]